MQEIRILRTAPLQILILSSWTATVDYGDGTGTQDLPLSGQNFSLS